MTKQAKQAAAAAVTPLPHSWGVAKWPAHVYPHSVTKARYLIRTHCGELAECGAVTRIGREVVVLGAGWAMFMARNFGRVKGFDATARMNEANARRRAEALAK